MQIAVRAVVPLVSLLVVARVGLAACDPTVEPDRTDVATARAAVATACDCAGAAKHGDYVRCATTTAETSLTNKSCVGAVRRCAARSTCGRAGAVTCCRTRSSGKTSCAVKRSAARCVAPHGGGACVGAFDSCCDACGAGGCNATSTTSTSTTSTSSTTTTTLTPCGPVSGGSCDGGCPFPFDVCVADQSTGNCGCVRACSAPGGPDSCGGECFNPAAFCTLYPGGCGCIIPCDPSECPGCSFPQACVFDEFTSTCGCFP